MVNKRNCFIGFILAIVLIIGLMLLGSGGNDYSSSNVEVENLSVGNGYYSFHLSFRPTQDMPNARVTVKLYDTEGNFITQEADGILVQSNFEGGEWYGSDMNIYSSKAPSTELGYVQVEVSNTQNLDILEGKVYSASSSY